MAAANDDDKKLIRLIRTGFAANIFLFIGGCMYVGFYARELVVAWWTRDALGDAFYMIGFLSFFLSGLVELWIDIGWVRTFDHGRYTTKKNVNIVITILFLLGNIGDLIAFMFWREGPEGIQQENVTQWVASHVFLVTAILVLVTNRPKYVPFQNGMDSLANIFFFVESLLVCCARYISTVGDTQRNQTEMYLELSSAVFSIASATSYVLADQIRLKDPSKTIHS